MDDSQIELLTKKERLLEEEIAHLQDAGLRSGCRQKGGFG
jgi:hypothetical protein